MQRVIVLGQLPMLRRNPVRTLRMDSLGIPTDNSVTAEARDANAVIEAAVRDFPHVTFADFSASPPFASPPFFDHELIYMDRHHLNEIGSLRYAQAAGQPLAKLLFPSGRPSSP
jgi:hypothetical protein